MKTNALVRRTALLLASLALLSSLSCAPEEVSRSQTGSPMGGGGMVPVPDLLDPMTIPKFVDPLVVPPVMPRTTVLHNHHWWKGKHQWKKTDYYEIAVRQFRQQILPSGFPQTTVWGYGSVNHAGTFNSPAFTIEARVDRPVRVKWINQLVDARRKYLPHLLPVDQTLHWANPPGPRDSMGMDPMPYTGPVPIVTHVHGAHVGPVSDGYPEAWYLPWAKDIPAGYYRKGTHYDSVVQTEPGSAVFEYPNDQRPTTLWYHDHALGMTRLNVYTGMAGFYLVRGDDEEQLNLPRRAPQLGDKPGKSYHEIPIAIQDRSFKQDGSLFYPATREYFDGYPGPYHPTTDVPPIWNPEFFGNTIMVNGKTWPFHKVEPRKYRLRFLNGCQSRFLILKFDQPIPFHQIGNEGGFLPAPVTQQEILMAPAERADVIVDFSALQPGQQIVLLNLGPDAPFGGLPVDTPADPNTTGKVMAFQVVPLQKKDHSSIPTALPSAAALGPEIRTRDLTLNERMSTVADIPVAALLGTARDGALTWTGLDPSGTPAGTRYKNVYVTENPRLGDTEVWRIINLTADAHPIHLHLVMFEVLDRTPFDPDAYAAAQQAYIIGGKVGSPPDPLTFATGPAEPALAHEAGTKDTVIAPPAYLTRIKARFDLRGLYVWHCHILEHEDNEMMRPYYVGHIPGASCGSGQPQCMAH